MFSCNHNLALYSFACQKTIEELASFESSNRTLERGIEAAKREVKQFCSSNAVLNDSLETANKEVERLRETLSTKEGEYKQEVEQLLKETAQSETRLKKLLKIKERELAEEQAKTKEQERRCLQTQEHAMKQIADLAKDLERDDGSIKEKLMIAQDQILKFENIVTEQQRELKQLRDCHKAEVQKLQHACESCHQDLNIVILEKAEIDKNIDTERKRAMQYKKDLEESERSLQSLENKYHLLVDEKMKLSRKIEDLKHENISLEGRVKCTLENMRLLEEHVSNEREKADEALHNEVEKVKQQLDKEKRRSSAYKTKALESHRRSAKAKEVLACLPQRLTSTQKSSP